VDWGRVRTGDRARLHGSLSLPAAPVAALWHKLRHTYTSLLAALDTDPGAMTDLLGHTDPGFTLRVYRHSMRRDQQSKDQLRALVGVDDSGTGEVSGRNSGTNWQNGRVTSAAGTNGQAADTAV
jgi:hypothetical protein